MVPSNTLAMHETTLNRSAVDACLAQALARREKLRRADTSIHQITAYRLFNRQSDGIDGLAVDVYDDWLVAHFYDLPALERELLLDAFETIQFKGVYTKIHLQQANEMVGSKGTERAPHQPSRGNAAPETLTVYEFNVPYLVRLADGLATGLYLDHRLTRAKVRELSAGKTVLNLFSYTCAFAVAAVAGRAKLVTNVDASRIALERGRLNVEQQKHTSEIDYWKSDVFRALTILKKKQRTFDIVIVDPPTYARTKHSRFSSEKDYGKLLVVSIDAVAPRGILIASSNYQRMTEARMTSLLQDAAHACNRKISDIKLLPVPEDFFVANGNVRANVCVLAQFAN